MRKAGSPVIPLLLINVNAALGRHHSANVADSASKHLLYLWNDRQHLQQLTSLFGCL